MESYKSKSLIKKIIHNFHIMRKFYFKLLKINIFQEEATTIYDLQLRLIYVELYKSKSLMNKMMKDFPIMRKF